MQTWEGTLTSLQFVSLLEGEFFPKWMRTLHSWLTNAGPAGPDFGEVEAWYRGWKSTFPQAAQTHPAVEAHFKRALGMMNAVVQGLDALAFLRQPGMPADVSYKHVVEHRRLEQRAKEQARVSAAAASRAEAEVAERLRAQRRGGGGDTEADEGSISFKEVVESFAETNGIEFVPNVRRGRQDGNQVYSFGRANVYINQNVVFAQGEGPEKRQQWDPISLQALLERVRRKPKPKRAKPPPPPAAPPAAAAAMDLD